MVMGEVGCSASTLDSDVFGQTHKTHSRRLVQIYHILFFLRFFRFDCGDRDHVVDWCPHEMKNEFAREKAKLLSAYLYMLERYVHVVRVCICFQKDWNRYKVDKCGLDSIYSPSEEINIEETSEKMEHW